MSSTSTKAADPTLGEVHLLTHGTTLHGAQSDLRVRTSCSPAALLRAATRRFGQVFAIGMQKARPRLQHRAAVGPRRGRGRQLTCDPAVCAALLRDRSLTTSASPPTRLRFTYIRHCAHGPVGVTLGDARLTLARQAPASYDRILVDAFSSDSVPAHLLTVEALRLYLSGWRRTAW